MAKAIEVLESSNPPTLGWTGAAKVLPVRILFRQRVEDADGGLSSRPQLLRHPRFLGDSTLPAVVLALRLSTRTSISDPSPKLQPFSILRKSDT